MVEGAVKVAGQRHGAGPLIIQLQPSAIALCESQRQMIARAEKQKSILVLSSSSQHGLAVYKVEHAP